MEIFTLTRTLSFLMKLPHQMHLYQVKVSSHLNLVSTHFTHIQNPQIQSFTHRSLQNDIFYVYIYVFSSQENSKVTFTNLTLTSLSVLVCNHWALASLKVPRLFTSHSSGSLTQGFQLQHQLNTNFALCQLTSIVSLSPHLESQISAW